MEEWTEIGRIEDIPRQGARVVRTSRGEIAVFRTATDEVFALRDRCPHKGGPLSQGIVAGKTVTCPLHNWNIQLESGDAVAPDKGCAATFSVKVVKGVVYISIPIDQVMLASIS